jgi:ketosteroid isomerase-like protein
VFPSSLAREEKNMNSPTPTEVFQQILTGIGAGDAQAMLGRCRDDVVFEFPFAPAGRPKRLEGKGAVGEYLAVIAAGAVPDRLTNLEMHQTVDPEVAVIEFSVTGRVRDTDSPFARSYVVVLTVRDGLVVRYRDYWNPLDSFTAGSGT